MLWGQPKDVVETSTLPSATETEMPTKIRRTSLGSRCQQSS